MPDLENLLANISAGNMEKGPLERAAVDLHDEFCNHDRCFGFEHHSDSEQDRYRRTVRAVLQAIREPSREMANAGHGRWADEADWTAIYQAMIDAALAE